MKIARCVRANSVRKGDQVLSDRGYVTVADVDGDGYWRETGVIKIEFTDGDYETLKPKERVMVMR